MRVVESVGTVGLWTMSYKLISLSTTLYRFCNMFNSFPLTKSGMSTCLIISNQLKDIGTYLFIQLPVSVKRHHTRRHRALGTYFDVRLNNIIFIMFIFPRVMDF